MSLPDHAAPAGPRLAGYPLFASDDLDQTRDEVARVFCPHRLDVIGGAGIHARHNHAPGEQLSLNYLEYGAKTLIVPGELQSFYLVQIPLTGAAAIAQGSDRYYSGPRAAAVLNPHLPVSMIWEAGTRQVLVQIDRAAMTARLERLMGGRARAPLEFRGPLDLTTPAGQRFRNLVMFLIGEHESGSAGFDQLGLMRRQFEQTLITGLIEAHPNNYSLFLGRRPGAALPRHVRLAEEYILAHLDQPLTIEDIAAAAGSTPRSLQLGFRQFRGTTPLSFWRDRRLLAAHQALLRGAEGRTVTEVATDWGFTHLGRFSQIYRERFGQTPSETLRAATGAGWSD